MSGIIDLGEKSSAIHHEIAQLAQPVVDEVWHIGQDGVAEFKTVFGPQLVTEVNEVAQRMQNLDNQTLVLVEGRIHKWLENSLWEAATHG